MKPLPVFACDIELRVQTEITGETNRVLMNPRKLSIPFDETAEFHGVGAHWSADELFLGSILVSLSNTFLYFVRKRKDRFVFSKLALEGSIAICYDEKEHIYHVTNIDVKGHLDVPPHHAKEGQRLWDLTVKTCHILHSIDQQITIQIKVEVLETNS